MPQRELRARRAAYNTIAACAAPSHLSLAPASEYAARAMPAERMAARAESELRWSARGNSQRYTHHAATLRRRPMASALISETAHESASKPARYDVARVTTDVSHRRVRL